MKRLLTLGSLFLMIGCTVGRIEFRKNSGICQGYDSTIIDSPIPVDITDDGFNEYKKQTQDKNKIDSVAKSLNLEREGAFLVNTSTSKKYFTVKIETELNGSVKYETKIFKLFPGEEKELGCTYFGVFLLKVDSTNITKESTEIGSRKFELVGSLDSK